MHRLSLKENGARLVGQCEISHPVHRAAVRITFEGVDEDPLSPVDDLDGTIAKPSNVLFESSKKDEYEPLDARISRTYMLVPLTSSVHIIINAHTGLFYINAYANEIHPSPNQDYISNLATKEVLVYSCGSLWTR